MHIQHNISLKPYNTFGINVFAKLFASFNSIELLKEQIELQPSNIPLLILGGGSNVLFTQNFDGLVLKNELKGIELLHEDATTTIM
jgi:UDP-N-acetylmuramate dehydrogenase